MCSIIHQIAKTNPSAIPSIMNAIGATFGLAGAIASYKLLVSIGTGCTACGYIQDCQRQWRDGHKEIQAKRHGGLEKRSLNDRLDHLQALPASPRERWLEHHKSPFTVEAPHGSSVETAADTDKQATSTGVPKIHWMNKTHQSLHMHIQSQSCTTRLRSMSQSLTSTRLLFGERALSKSKFNKPSQETSQKSLLSPPLREINARNKPSLNLVDPAVNNSPFAGTLAGFGKIIPLFPAFFGMKNSSTHK